MPVNVTVKMFRWITLGPRHSHGKYRSCKYYCRPSHRPLASLYGDNVPRPRCKNCSGATKSPLIRTPECPDPIKGMHRNKPNPQNPHPNTHGSQCQTTLQNITRSKPQPFWQHEGDLRDNRHCGLHVVADWLQI